MRILYIQQYFKPPNQPGSTRSYWISKTLIEKGYDVTVVCHANIMQGKNQDKRIEETVIEGIRVISILNAYSNNMNVKQRIWSFLKFMFFSTFVALKEKDVDLVFASSTPLTVAVPALMRKLFRKTPYIFEVRDLWPEAPIQLGFIKNKVLIKFLKWFEKTVYKNSEHVIALSPGMQEGVAKYIPKEKISMIPNMSKIDMFWVREKDMNLNDRFGLSNKTFKIIYFGTLGFANGIDYLMDAISLLENKKIENIEFIFMGDGVKIKDLQYLSANLLNVKVSILSRQPMDIVSAVVNNCDICICTFSNFPILKTNSPNKLFDSFSAGKPIIVNSDGWTKELVENYNCGFYVNPENVFDLADKILLLKENPELAAEMGFNARKLAEEKFDKSILCNDFYMLIKHWEESNKLSKK